jgi:hypothetical protein
MKGYLDSRLTSTNFRHESNNADQHVLHPKILDTLAQLRPIRMVAIKWAAMG